MLLTGVLANEKLAKYCQMNTLFFSFADGQWKPTATKMPQYTRRTNRIVPRTCRTRWIILLDTSAGCLGEVEIDDRLEEGLPEETAHDR